jgi:hypothetical protein
VEQPRNNKFTPNLSIPVWLIRRIGEVRGGLARAEAARSSSWADPTYELAT